MMKASLALKILTICSGLLLGTLTFNDVALAGGYSVGNGGVIWSCRSGIGDQVFHAGILSDLFEAREQYKLPLIEDPGGDPFALYENRKLWLAAELPDLSRALETRFEYVEKHLTYVNAELLSTRDFNNAIKPTAASCPLGTWQPLNIANFREDDQQVLISKELWDSPNIPTLDKAALLFHEAVYYWMRTQFGAVNSDKARKITGVLFSTLSADKIKNEIAKVLGRYPDQPDAKYLCVMKNSRRNQLYVAFEEMLKQAEISVRLRCQDDPEAMWCSLGSLECEAIEAHSQHQCLASNSHTGKLFVGKGRSRLEAKFSAHISCFVGSQAQGGHEQHCPDFEFMECD